MRLGSPFAPGVTVEVEVSATAATPHHRFASSYQLAEPEIAVSSVLMFLMSNRFDVALRKTVAALPMFNIRVCVPPNLWA